MAAASTPWSDRRIDPATSPTAGRPAWWPWFAALGLFLMGIGATLGGIGGTAAGQPRTPAPVAVAVDQPQRQVLSARLTSIAPGLAVMTPERLSASAALTCTDLQADLPPDDLTLRVVARFGGGGYTLSDQQAGEIVAAVRSGFCDGTGFTAPG